MKTLRCWNGRGFNSRGDTLYVAAYSRRDAARLLAAAAMKHWRTGRQADAYEIGTWDRDLKNYFSECWGNSMAGIQPKRGVWYQLNYSAKPRKLQT